MHESEIRGIQALASDLRSKIDTIINDLEEHHTDLTNGDEFALDRLSITISELKDLI